MSKSTLGIWRNALRASDIDSTARCVGWALETYASPVTLQAWPSVQTLADATALSRRAVGHALRRLEDAGYLTVEWSRGNSPHRFTFTNPTAHDVRSDREQAAQSTAHLTTPDRAFEAPHRASDDISPRTRFAGSSLEAVRSPSEATRARESLNDGKSGWVPNLSRYTGCTYVRGEGAMQSTLDPLGTERPPPDWPYLRPTRQDITDALEAKRTGHYRAWLSEYRERSK